MQSPESWIQNPAFVVIRQVLLLRCDLSEEGNGYLPLDGLW